MISIAAPPWLTMCDGVVGALLTPLAIVVLISGLDDLLVDVVWAAGAIRRRGHENTPREPRGDESLQKTVAKRIAIFVPLWHEHAVIRGMLEHNIAAIDYRNYDFFVGAYPNDHLTINAVQEVQARYSNVHLAVCPHDGPTSKADCLNWIYQRMLLHEEKHDIQYEIVVTHDAEDLIHPASLKTLSEQAGRFDMVQIPVLPLPTSPLEIVHGIYCDEFAEFQIKDMPARRLMGSFTPSAGVGTGYTRRALQKLADSASNRVFEPVCLTEDYENGMRLHALGCPQKFIPLHSDAARAVATREYFPRTFRAAVRQRTRWVTGIALQSWDRHGWSGPLGQVYWFWRDRKGLIGNPLSLASNLMFLYGMVTSVLAPATRFAHYIDPRIMAATLGLLAYRTAIRMACVGRLYGPLFAAAAPIRCVCANLINCIASFGASVRFLRAKVRGEPLVWLKTEHGYPSRTALLAHKRKLGEILTSSGYIGPDDLERALEMKPHDLRLGEYLVRQRLISEQDLLEALSLQHGVPAGPLEPDEVSPVAARTLPRHVVQNWQVLPFRITAGNLHVATINTPTDEMTRELRGFTGLEMRFQLITTENFERLLELL